jgi:hypothetical protein
MTGNSRRLAACLRGAARPLYFAAVAAADWPEVRLRLELDGAEFAAMPVSDAGWGVLTPDPLGGSALDVSACWQGVLDGYLVAHGAGGIALSEGWAAGACAQRRTDPEGNSPKAS